MLLLLFTMFITGSMFVYAFGVLGLPGMRFAEISAPPTLTDVSIESEAAINPIIEGSSPVVEEEPVEEVVAEPIPEPIVVDTCDNKPLRDVVTWTAAEWVQFNHCLTPAELTERTDAEGCESLHLINSCDVESPTFRGFWDVETWGETYQDVYGSKNTYRFDLCTKYLENPDIRGSTVKTGISYEYCCTWSLTPGFGMTPRDLGC